MHPVKQKLTSRSGLIQGRRWQGKELQLKVYRAVSTHGGVLAAVLAVVIFSALYFVAIRDHSVELSFDQLSAFERQVQTVGNHSVYVVEAGKQDDVLLSLNYEDWGRVSSRIDYVAFVYGEVSAVIVADGWVKKVAGALQETKPRGYGVVLFRCGCVLPNVMFTGTKTRFQGYECAMLPGFVVEKDAVRFVELAVEEEKCGNRDKILGSGWYKENSWKLEDSRLEHEALRKRLEGDGG